MQNVLCTMSLKATRSLGVASAIGSIETDERNGLPVRAGRTPRSATAALIGLGEDVFVLAVANDEGALALLLVPHELETS